MDHRRADPGAEGQQHDDAGLVAPRAVVLFGQARGVGVVEDRHPLAAQGGADDVVGVGADPGLVDVGGGLHHPVDDHAGVGDAQRTGPVEVSDHVGDGFGDGLRCGGLRGEQLEALTDEFAGVEIDDAALDPAAADVDTESSVGSCGAGFSSGHGCSSARRGVGAIHTLVRAGLFVSGSSGVCCDSRVSENRPDRLRTVAEQLATEAAEFARRRRAEIFGAGAGLEARRFGSVQEHPDRPGDHRRHRNRTAAAGSARRVAPR